MSQKNAELMVVGAAARTAVLGFDPWLTVELCARIEAEARRDNCRQRDQHE